MTSLLEALPFDFVVSYNQEEKELALSLVDSFEEFGLHGWIDERYYYVPLKPVERQLAAAFSGCRFVIVLVPDAFRDSDWCRAEYNEGLLAQEALALDVVLVATSGNSQAVPSALARCIRFAYNSPDQIRDAARFIISRRRCLRRYSRPVRRIMKRWRAMRLTTEFYRACLTSDQYMQLQAINDVCLWVLRALGSTNATGKAGLVVSLHNNNDAGELLIRYEEFEELAFTDTIRTDAIPIQRFLFDQFFFDSVNGEVSRSIALDKILWNQLLILSHATNRYFLQQLRERASYIVSEKLFCLFDESAQNHFFEIWGDSWVHDVLKNPHLLRPANSPCRRPLATLCEHISLSAWRKRWKMRERLPHTLPKPERISLALRGFRKLAERFTAGGNLHRAPEGAVRLGLTTAGLHYENHASPSLALDQFHYTVVEIIGEREYHSLNSSCEIERNVLEALSRAIEEVIPIYVDYVRVAHDRRGASSLDTLNKGISHYELLTLWDCTVSDPLKILHNGGMDLTRLREIVRSALEIFSEKGDPQAQAHAAHALRNIERLGIDQIRLNLNY